MGHSKNGIQSNVNEHLFRVLVVAKKMVGYGFMHISLSIRVIRSLLRKPSVTHEVEPFRISAIVRDK